MNDTIFAPATLIGRAAVTVVRISGPATAGVTGRLCRKMPPPRHASLRSLVGRGNEVLDRCIVLWLPGPASYTGEDCAELHLHGGIAVLDAVVAELIASGLRPAEPGEFTRRAFLAGKLDLTEAEAVADLIDAETGEQRRQALRQLGGELGALARSVVQRLTELLAMQEAVIDFPEDMSERTDAIVRERATELALELRRHAAGTAARERVRQGIVVAVLGAPNAGKSSLINALAGRDVAIVSPFPGTTRDVIEARVVLADLPVTLLDTAGLRETDDPVEAEGVRRARLRADAADIVLFLIDATSQTPVPAIPTRALTVASKTDLAPGPPGTLATSVVVKGGVSDLRQALAAEVNRITAARGAPGLNRARHRAAFQDAASHLETAANSVLPELCGESLRLALRSAGRVTGRVGVERILDEVFATFCIGK